MKLVTADELSLAAFADMIDDYAAFGTPFLGITDPECFPYFVRTCVKHSGGIGVGFHGAYTRYFLVDDLGTIYAQGDVRHYATQNNVRLAGQLGYGVLPSKRKQGYGRLMCSLLLKQAKEKGFSSLIITCRDDNEGSAKIIESNGGTLIEKCISPKDNVLMRRYEVNL